MYICVRVSSALELELQAFMSCHVVLRIELRSFGRAASAPNHWTIFPASSLTILKGIDYWYYIGNDLHFKEGYIEFFLRTRNSFILKVKL